jgi:hypothetical protein
MSISMVDIFHGEPYILWRELSFYLPDTRMGA